MPLCLFGIWAAVSETGLVAPIYLPPPSDIVDTAVALRSEILSGLWVSLRMVAIGVCIGAAAGIVAGLAFGYSRWARGLFEATVDLVRPVPLFALIPLFILWFGIGILPQITLVAVGVFLLLSLTTIEAIRVVPQIYVRAALTSGASRLQIYRTVVIPAIMPNMLAGVRFAIAFAWGLDVAAELIGSQEGLGYLMVVRQRALDTAGILVPVFIFCTLAIITDRLARLAVRHFTRWSEGSVGSGMIGDMLGQKR